MLFGYVFQEICYYFERCERTFSSGFDVDHYSLSFLPSEEFHSCL